MVQGPRWLGGSPVQLAWMRIVVATVLLSSADVHGAVAWADQLGIDPLISRTAYAAILGGGVLALLGVSARLGLALAATGALYLLGLRQVGAGPVHNHHLVWLAALLACTPCDHALTVRRVEAPAPAVAYGIGVRAALLVLGLVYLFPGLHKLAGDWLTGDALVQHLYWKWAQTPGFDPLFHVDGWLARPLSVAVIAFEIAVTPLLQLRRTRPVAIAGAVAFHLGTGLVAGIWFTSLLVLFAMALPVDRATHGDRRPSPTLPALGAAAIVLPVCVAGVLGAQHAWPFACYPTFAGAPGTRMPVVEVTAVHPDGERHLDVVDGQRTVGEQWQLRDEAAFEAFWARHAPRLAPQLGGATAVRFYRTTVSVLPEDAGEAPVLGAVAHEITLR